jgi:hypothetical protein
MAWLANHTVQPVRPPATEAIAGSCCIVCTNGIHHGTFDRLASDHISVRIQQHLLNEARLAKGLEAALGGLIFFAESQSFSVTPGATAFT